MLHLWIVTGILITHIPLTQAAQEGCAQKSTPAICTDTVGCYFDEFRNKCLNWKPDCDDIADEEDDPEVWGAVYGYVSSELDGKGRIQVEDYCRGNIVYQAYCKSDQAVGWRYETCTFGCQQGICIEDEGDDDVENISCNDSDSGKRYYDAGFTHQRQFQNDSCIDAETLSEGICESNIQKAELYTCPFGCEGGRCNPIDITITSIVVAKDYQSATVTLSETPTFIPSLRHRLRRDGGDDIETGLSYQVDGKTVTIDNLQALLKKDQQGGGMFVLTLAICPESGHVTGDGIVAACSKESSATINYVPTYDPLCAVEDKTLCLHSGCYFDDLEQQCTDASLLCTQKNGDDGRIVTWGFDPESDPQTHRQAFEHYCEGSTRVSFACAADQTVRTLKRTCLEGCIAGKCISLDSTSNLHTNPNQHPSIMFPDVNPTLLSGRAAEDLYTRGVIQGFPDGTFGGEHLVNRAEAAKMIILARYGTVTETPYRGRFNDISGEEWFAPFVAQAADFDIIRGHPDGNFRPADPVNTAEFLAMMVRAFGLSKEVLPHSFYDVPEGVWFEDFAGMAQHRKFFPDRTTQLMPDTPLSRYDVVIALYQYALSAQ